MKIFRGKNISYAVIKSKAGVWMNADDLVTSVARDIAVDILRELNLPDVHQLRDRLITKISPRVNDALDSAFKQGKALKPGKTK